MWRTAQDFDVKKMCDAIGSLIELIRSIVGKMRARGDIKSSEYNSLVIALDNFENWTDLILNKEK